MQEKFVYLDNAATSRVLPEAQEIYIKTMAENFYNPSALYGKAIEVSREIKKARESIASILGVLPETIFFTSSGTESDNQALLCSRKKNGSRVIISATEHAAVYNTALQLKQQGYDLRICPTDKSGRVDLNELEKLLTDNTSLVSIMHVNNVTGAINDLNRISLLIKEKAPNALFHSDGVQAFCKIPTKLKNLGVDLYSVSSHKVGAVKGSGFIYVRKGLQVAPLIYGGGQESGIRSSTENVGGILSFAKAAGIYRNNREKLCKKSESFFGDIKECVKGIGDSMILCDDGAPHILAIAFKDVRGEVLMHTLEDYGYITGIGSACSSKKGLSRIPQALKLPMGYEEGILRISINPFDEYESEPFNRALTEAVETLRKFVRV